VRPHIVPLSQWRTESSAPADSRDMAQRTRVHLVGIGGIGMSGIAEVLLTSGHGVTGSDLHESDATRRLRALGAEIRIGHDADHVGPETDVVVISSAVNDANPEVVAARGLRIPVIPRAEMLAELMRPKFGIAVAGAHGKTTTTSLVAAVLAEAGADPTLVIGGRLKSLGGTNARLGSSPYIVAEADESDGSFLMLRPTLVVVTNVDREHMTYYGTMDRLVDSYVSFINSIPFYGRAILCADCPRVVGLLDRVNKRFVTYGTSPECDLAARDIRYRGLRTEFDVLRRGVALGRVELSMPGRHVVLNALAAISIALELGIDFRTAADALAAFAGIERRFDIKGEYGGITVVDDYGHHPTEIRATLAAARRAFEERRILAVFQPHRYSRTADLFHEFTEAFDDADVVVVTDIYAAGEEPAAAISGSGLAAAIARRRDGAIHYRPAGPQLAGEVARLARRGDVVLTLGAGDITRLGPRILAELESVGA
jgi:UDP-N-acetylmuramate--alanine ligase